MTDFNFDVYFAQGERDYYSGTECSYDPGSKEAAAWREGYDSSHEYELTENFRLLDDPDYHQYVWNSDN